MCRNGIARWTNLADRSYVWGGSDGRIRRSGDQLKMERCNQGFAGDRVHVVHPKRCYRRAATAIHLPCVAAAASGALFPPVKEVQGNELAAAKMRSDGHAHRDQEVQQKKGDMGGSSHVSIRYAKRMARSSQGTDQQELEIEISPDGRGTGCLRLSLPCPVPTFEAFDSKLSSKPLVRPNAEPG